MANLGGEKIFLVLLLALVVLGPERLPVVARKIGAFMRYAKEMTSGFQNEVRKAVDFDLDGDHSPVPAPTPEPTTEPVAATARPEDLVSSDPRT